MFGLSCQPATGFNDLATTVRLSPDGVIDARNGDHFQADAVLSYSAGLPRRLRILANVQTHTCPAYASSSDQNSVQSARSDAFRTTRAAAFRLDSLMRSDRPGSRSASDGTPWIPAV